jgi:hypothetical protein
MMVRTETGWDGAPNLDKSWGKWILEVELGEEKA